MSWRFAELSVLSTVPRLFSWLSRSPSRFTSPDGFPCGNITSDASCTFIGAATESVGRGNIHDAAWGMLQNEYVCGRRKYEEHRERFLGEGHTVLWEHQHIIVLSINSWCRR